MKIDVVYAVIDQKILFRFSNRHTLLNSIRLNVCANTEWLNYRRKIVPLLILLRDRLGQMTQQFTPEVINSLTGREFITTSVLCSSS